MAIDGLGRPLTVQEAASALGVDEATATRYFSTLGGVRIGKRRIVFFERKVLDAIEKLQLEQGGLELRPHLFFFGAISWQKQAQGNACCTRKHIKSTSLSAVCLMPSKQSNSRTFNVSPKP